MKQTFQSPAGGVRKILAALLALTAALISLLTAVSFAADVSDYPSTAAEKINNLDVLGTKSGGFSNGEKVISVSKTNAIEVSFAACLVRGWSVSMEGTTGFYYQLGFIKANGSTDTGEPVSFDAEKREDVLAANPGFADANAGATVGINLVLPIAEMKAGTYQFDVYALTKENKKYQVFKGYVRLVTNYNVNGDGCLDIRDAIAFRRILADGSAYNSSYDFNGDGFCDEHDYNELMYAIMDRMVF